MQKWLQYLKWYWMLNMDLDMGTDPLVLLARALDPPVVITGWKVNQTDPVLVKFGLLWKVYDYVGQRGLNWMPPVLGES